MTPEDLAARHPRLYHVTEPGAAESVARHGLLSASRIAALMGMPLTARRPAEVPLTHPDHGTMILNDQSPLSEAKLAACLDDGLTPAQWIAMLNERVFFWPDEKAMQALLTARANRARGRDVLVFDTLGIARAHGARMALSPFNSGSTLRKPVRRGRATYTPLGAVGYREWRGLRRASGIKKSLDSLREVTVMDAVPDARDHLHDVIEHRP